MDEYEFEIQSLIKVKIVDVDKEDARLVVINKLYDGQYDAELEAQSMVSIGKKVSS